jgi:hypothetical protein
VVIGTRGDVLFVRGRVHQVRQVRGGRLDANHPALAPGILGHGLQVLLDGLVHLDDLASNGGEQVGDGLHGLDLSEGLAGIDRAAGLRQVTVDEVVHVAVAELFDGEVGDADQDGVSILLGPLVGGSVTTVVGAHGGVPSGCVSRKGGR